MFGEGKREEGGVFTKRWREVNCRMMIFWRQVRVSLRSGSAGLGQLCWDPPPCQLELSSWTLVSFNNVDIAGRIACESPFESFSNPWGVC